MPDDRRWTVRDAECLKLLVSYAIVSLMDVLSDVLAVMRTGRPRSARAEWHGSWAQEFAAVPGAAGFHVLLRGSCVLLRDGAEPVSLKPGDIAFRPHGDGHVLADSPGTRPVGPACGPGTPAPVPTAPAAFSAFAAPAAPAAFAAGSGSSTVVVCGAYELDPGLAHPLILGLPDLIHIPAGQRPPQLDAAVAHLAAEITEPGPGFDALIPALLDVMLVHLLRTRLTGTHPSGWSAALHDPMIGTALRAMHRDPGHPWTVATLAAAAGSSRAPFARRFTELLGQPPLTYLTWWRMTLAANLLRHTDNTLNTIATRVGYRSEFAFAAAFKRRFTEPPGRYRRRL